MRYALDRAASYLRDDIAKYHIEVPEGKRIVIRRGAVTTVDPFTTYPKCLTLLRAMIRDEKEIEKRKQLKNQGVLFE